MAMQIIEIQNTRYGEVAYVYDEASRQVLKLPVQDLTGYNDNVNEVERPVVRRPRQRTVAPVRELEPEPEPEFEDSEENIEQPAGFKVVNRNHPPVRERRTLPKSIMPPGIAGVFKQPGQPGEAIERRTA